MSALEIEVRATRPPSQCVEVLGQRVHVGPADVFNPVQVLVYILGPVVAAERGEPSPSPNRPRLPDFASPLALVLLPAAAGAVHQQHITILDPSGAPE